jgi:hypothetical protein
VYQGGIGKGLRLLDDRALDDVIAKSWHLLDLFGYKVSGRRECEDGSTKGAADRAASSTGSGAQVSDASKQARKKFREDADKDGDRDDSTEEGNSISAPAALTAKEGDGDNRIRRGSKDKDSASHKSIGSEIPSSASRSLEILPLRAQTPQQWASEFRAVLSSRLRSAQTESDSEVEDVQTQSRVTGQNASHPEAGAVAATAPGLDIWSDARASIVINEPFSVRLPEDLYGRRLTEIRRLYTDDDCNPLEVE